MGTRGHGEEERGGEQTRISGRYEDGGVRLSGTRTPPATHPLPYPTPGPGSISGAANTRVVYLLIIEKQQQLSPSSHHLVELEVWGRGHQVTPPLPFASCAAEGLCSVATVWRNFPEKRSARQNKLEVIDLPQSPFYSRVLRSSPGSSTLPGSHPAAVSVPKIRSATGAPLSQYGGKYSH